MSLKKSLIYVILLLLTALVFSGCGSKAAPAQEVSAAESGEKSAQAEAQETKSSDPSAEAPQAPSSEAKPQEDPASKPAASEPAGKDSAPSAEDPGKAVQPSQPENKPAEAPAQTDPAAPSDNTQPSEKTEPAAPSEPASPSEHPANTDAKPEAPAEGNGGKNGSGKEKKDSYSRFFEDSLFIGDSRSVGLVEYGNVGEPTAFCHTGLSVYNYDNDDLDVAGFGKISLADLLELGSFDKVYVGLGINELGYAEDTTVQKFGELIDLIKANQPSANIYVLANLHVTAARSRKDKIHNNGKIDSLNSRLESLCDGTKVIYIDGNPLFDDGNGALSEDFTGDNTHLYARCYPTWSQLIYESSKQ